MIILKEKRLYCLNPYIIIKIMFNDVFLILDTQTSKYHLINERMYRILDLIEQNNMVLEYDQLCVAFGEECVNEILGHNILISYFPTESILYEQNKIEKEKNQNTKFVLNLSYLGVNLIINSCNENILKNIFDIYRSFVSGKKEKKNCTTVNIYNLRETFKKKKASSKWVHSYSVLDVKIYDDLNRKYKYLVGDNFECLYDVDMRNVDILIDIEQPCIEIIKILIDLSFEVTLRKKGWIAVHCASIKNTKNHVLLMGTSGIGKTTLSRKLCYNNNFELLSDDRYYVNVKKEQGRGYCYGSAITNNEDTCCIKNRVIDKTCRINTEYQNSDDCVCVFMEKLERGQALTCLSQKEIIKYIVKAVLDSNHNFGMMNKTKAYYVNLLDAYEFCLAKSKSFLLNTQYNENLCAEILLQTLGNYNVKSDLRCVKNDYGVVKVNKNFKNHFGQELLLCINNIVIKIIGNVYLLNQISKEYECYVVQNMTPRYILEVLDNDFESLNNLTTKWEMTGTGLQYLETSMSWIYYFPEECLIVYNKNQKNAKVLIALNQDGYSYIRSVIGFIVQMLSIENGEVCLHAALLCNSQKKGVLLIGPKCAGKTTLSYWLQEAGYYIQSDETTILKRKEDKFFATGIKRDITLRNDISKFHRLDTHEKLFFPFSQESKTIVKLEEKALIMDNIEITDMYRLNIHEDNCFDISSMSTSNISSEIYKSGLLDLPNIDYTNLQKMSFDIATKIKGQWCFINKDIGKMRENIIKQFGVK